MLKITKTIVLALPIKDSENAKQKKHALQTSMIFQRRLPPHSKRRRYLLILRASDQSPIQWDNNYLALVTIQSRDRNHQVSQNDQSNALAPLQKSNYKKQLLLVMDQISALDHMKSKQKRTNLIPRQVLVYLDRGFLSFGKNSRMVLFI